MRDGLRTAPFAIEWAPAASKELEALKASRQTAVRRSIEAVARATALRAHAGDDWLEVSIGQLVAECRVELVRRVLTVYSLRPRAG